MVLQRDSETIGLELHGGLIERRPELKHPSMLSAADVAQLQAESVSGGLSVCLHSGWLDYRNGDDTQWAPRWVTLIQEAAHAPSSLLHADQEDGDAMSPAGLCWLLVHTSATTRDEPQAVIPLASYVVKNKVAQHKFSVVVCGAGSSEAVHKFRAASSEPEPASAIFGWMEVMDGTVQPTLNQVLRASVAKLQAQPDRIVHAGWVKREISTTTSFFAGKSWGRSWAVLWAEPVRAGGEGETAAEVDSGVGGMRTHWLLFYSGPEAEAPLLAVPLIRGCLAVTSPKTARSGKPSVLVIRFHSRQSKGWKHVLSFGDVPTMQQWELALKPFTAANSGSYDMSQCSAVMLESSDHAKAGWLHWLDMGGKAKAGAAGSWAKRWSVLVPGGSSTETWLVAFESATATAPVAVAHIMSDSVVDVVAPPVGCVASGRCIRLTGSLSQVVKEPAEESEASPHGWKHVAKAWRYLVIAEDDSDTSQWFEAVQRLRTKSQRHWTEGLIQGLKPALSPAGFEDSRKQGLAILLAFLDVVGIRSSSWGHDSSLPGASPHAGQNRNRNRTMIQSYIQSHTDVLFSGFLYKQGVSVKSWKKRFVILKDNMLIYQLTAEGGATKGKRGGVVNLTGAWSVEPLRGDADDAARPTRQHCFALYTHGRTLLLSAETAEHKDAWMAALNKLRSRTGDDALRRGVQGMFGAQANADPSGPLQALLHTLQYEVHSLCEFGVLKKKMLEALDAMEPDEHAASLADAQNDLGEMEISPSEVQIKELLAEGFFGKVYRGEYHGLDVAIKKLKTDQLKADDQNQVELIAELRSEVDVLTTLRHPNVVLIMGASTQNPANLFIVTEFLDRGCLYNVIHNPLLTDDQTCRMIEQVVLAVNFLHGRTPRIIHRDLKPLNILCDKNLNIRVGDFGISCRDREKEYRDQTQGTFAYMAPEVVTGRASASAESDVFSFGVVLFEWLFIRDKFDSGNDFQNNDDYCYDNIHDFVHTGREPRIPGWWHPATREIIKQCLAADPSSRPNMADVLLRIRELGAVCKTEIYVLRRYAVEELQGQLCPPSMLAVAGVVAGDGDEAADKQAQQTQAKLLHEHPDVLEVVLGLAKYAGTDALCYEAIVTYLGVADGPVLRDISEATTGGRQELSRATVMQAAAVNVLAEMPLTDLCVPGKRWVPLPWHPVGGGGGTPPPAAGTPPARSSRADETENDAAAGVFAVEEGVHLQEGSGGDIPALLTPTRSRYHTSGWRLPLTVPLRLLPVCGLLCSLDADVVRWTEEMLSTLPEEQQATSDDVRKTL